MRRGKSSPSLSSATTKPGSLAKTSLVAARFISNTEKQFMFSRSLATVAILSAGMLWNAASVHAQEARPLARNAIYAEIGGNALLYSLNYDRRLQDNVTARVGFMYVAAEGQDASGDRVDVSVAFFPLMMNLLVGTGSGRFELGAGPVLGMASGEAETLDEGDVELSAFGLAAFATTIGYRYQPVHGGFLFRAGLTPFYSNGFMLWGGLSFGYAF